MEEAEALDKLSDEVEYPSGSKLAIISLALCLSVFLVALVRTSQALLCGLNHRHAVKQFELGILILSQDNTIIATAIPRITDQFHALGDVGWYGSAYMVGPHEKK